MSDVLPIGTVISIVNREEKYVIVGKNVKNKGQHYDYCCVLYPYGFLIDKESLFYFNDSDVKSITQLGNINY